MKTIYLVRHGKAVGRDMDISDFERTLVERGVNDVTDIAGRIAGHGILPSLMITSPAPRALGTASVIADIVGYAKRRIRTRKVLYDQTDDALLELLTGLDEKYEDVMVIGHNPSIETFAEWLVKGGTFTFPTSGTAGIACSIDSWDGLNKNSGKLLFFETPDGKGRKPIKWKAVRLMLADEIANELEGYLAARSPKAAIEIGDTLKKVGDEVAAEFIKAWKKQLKHNDGN